MSNNNPIGLFDSGMGGLSVWREIRAALPAESLIFFGDGVRCPYGSRPESQVLQFTVEAVERLIAEGCKLIVIACNTATTRCIKYLRDKAHCKHEAYTKEEANAKMNELVKEIDVYKKSDFVEVTGNITISSGSTSRGTNIALPEGFTFENTRIISKWYRDSKTNMRFTDNNVTFYINGISSTPSIGASLKLDEAPTEDTTYEVGFLLLKLS